MVGEQVAAVRGDDDGAVDVAAAQVAQHPVLLLARPRDQQDQLQVAGGRARVTMRSVRAKKGSVKTRSSGSGMTIPTESVRRVTRERAAGLGV